MSDKKIKELSKKNITSKINLFSLWLINLLKPKAITLEESVNELIKEHDLHETINNEEKIMLQNFVDFKDLRAYEVMVPRTFIVGIQQSASYNDLREKFITEEHTRLPVFKESVDEIIGFVHMKDFILFIGKEEEFAINKVLRELIYAPRSMKVVDLLNKMRQARIHIAIILDEYGGTEGLITIEDLVEEIIGDIKDEHDDIEEPELFEVDGDYIIIDSNAKIEDVEEKLNIILTEEEDDFETFGGFLLSYLGRIPSINEKLLHPLGLEIEIIDADQRKIKKAKVKIIGEV